MKKNNISIIGGAGHVGLPLGIALAKKNYNIQLIDIDTKSIKLINKGIIPFIEDGAKLILKNLLKKKKIIATKNLSNIKNSKYIIICIGTPIKENLKPETREFINFFKKLKNLLCKDHVIIIRSSVYPGICDNIYALISSKTTKISYCPERIVQGKSLIELPKLPQIVSGFNSVSIKESVKIFRKISKKIIYASILEAELIKLFSNAYRYIHFSIANQFFKISQEYNVDFTKLRKKMIDGYSRNTTVPKQGFTAGPCLLKDTMQLASFSKERFELGYAAMNINQNMPDYIIDNLKKNYNLRNETIGILGLAFKADIDDMRDSLSLKLIKSLKLNKFKFYYSDPYVSIKNNLKLKDLLKKCSIIIVATPHSIYKKIKINKNTKIIDIWNIIRK